MSLRSQAAALIMRFVSDIDAIIREHAERATLLALKKRGLTPLKRAKRLESAAPLMATATNRKAPSTKRRRQTAKTERPKARAAANRKTRKRRSKVPAEQLSLF